MTTLVVIKNYNSFFPKYKNCISRRLKEDCSEFVSLSSTIISFNISLKLLFIILSDNIILLQCYTSIFNELKTMFELR